MTLYDPSVSLTDLLLAGESLLFALFIAKQRSSLKKNLVVTLFLLLAISSFLGAIFHGFFPQKIDSPGGWSVWLLTTAALALTAIALWLLAAYFGFGTRALKIVSLTAPLYFVANMYAIYSIDYHYSTVVYFYAPALAAFLLVSILRARRNERGWTAVLFGLVLTIVATLIELSSFSIGVFDHNGLYHVVEAIALALLYRGFAAIN